MAKREVREGDILSIKCRVVRTSDDGEQVTLEVWSQRVTGLVKLLDITRQDKGPNWPA